MRKNYMTYQPKDGYIHDWLALGPCDEAVTEQPKPGETALDFRSRLLRSYDHVTSDFAEAPNELDTMMCGAEKLFWEMDSAQPDHMIDRSAFFPSYTRRRAWFFVRVSQPDGKQITLHLTTTCPADVWFNGKPVLHCEHIYDLADQTPRIYSFTASLRPGGNDLLLRLQQVAAGDAVLACAARLEGAGEKPARAMVPCLTNEGSRRQVWQRMFEHTYMDRAVYARDDQVNIVCRPDMADWGRGIIRLQREDGSIYAETESTFKSGDTINSIFGMQLPTSHMQAVLMPPAANYYELNFRARRKVPFINSNFRYALDPIPNQEERLIEVMQEAQRCYEPLVAETAKMALGWWDALDLGDLGKGLAKVKQTQVGVLPDLLAAIAMRLRMGHYEQFPADILTTIDDVILHADYTARDGSAPEHEQILLYACQILAGQALGKAAFDSTGQTGLQMRHAAEKQALAWMQRHAQTGFAAWNSHLDLLVSALANLVSLAKNEEVQELASVLLDKLLLGLALNSFRGTYAAPRREMPASIVRSGRLATESGMSRLLWGLGGFNGSFGTVVSLGLAGKEYELSTIIQSIGLDRSTELQSRERQMQDGEEVNTVTYRTPDYLLASAQDYRPGQHGRREHLWQATMGPEAIAFANLPASYSESDSRNAGWWRGNASLPRLAQWKDRLIGLYNDVTGAALGFSHAFFPIYAFDEHKIEGGWAFARSGNGYLAIYGGPAMQAVQNGLDVKRELRIDGKESVWLCQMGRAEVDGSFEEFCRNVSAIAPEVDGLHVDWQTVRGERLSFGWSEPFTINGEEQTLSGFPQAESPFTDAKMPAEDMDIAYGHDMLRLHFV